MSPLSSTKLWCPGPVAVTVGSQPAIVVARSEPNRQPLDLYQSQTSVGSPPARRRRSARQYRGPVAVVGAAHPGQVEVLLAAAAGVGPHRARRRGGEQVGRAPVVGGTTAGHHGSVTRAPRLLLAAVLLAATAACAGVPRPAPPAAVATTSGAGTAHAAHSSHPAAPDQPLRAGERFVDLTLPAPYTPAAPHGGADEYRCFLVDPGLTEPAFLTGSRFAPQNAAIVHHAIFFRVGPERVADARQADQRSPGEGWTCFGDAGIGGGAAWVAHWAPGTGETLQSPGTGYPMPPGSRLVMQVHYNLLGAERSAADRSGIRLRLTGRTDLTPLRTMLLPAPVELPCAAGESGPLCDRAAAVRDVAGRFGAQADGMVTQLNLLCNGGRSPVAGTVQRCDHAVSGPGTVHAVAGHMHLLGRSITVRLNPGRPGGRTLLDVPAYDFDEQAVVPLPEPVPVAAGDTLQVTCTHDAGLRWHLPQLRELPPRYVVWGEGTSDEMCLGLVVWSPAG